MSQTAEAPTTKTRIKNILISQPKPESPKSPYYSLAKKHKINIDFRQFIQIEGVSTKEFRKSRVVINDYSGVILTSRNSIDHFFRICDAVRVKMSQETKYFCVSEAIALYLQKYIQYRKRKVFYGNGSLKELKTVLLKYKDTENILLPGSDIRNNDLTEFLEDNGFKYKEAVIYKTVSSDLSDLKIDSFDMLVFFSPSGVKSLFQNFPKYKQKKTKIAGFGPATCKAIEDLGLQLDLRAPIPEARSMSMAIDLYLGGLK